MCCRQSDGHDEEDHDGAPHLELWDILQDGNRTSDSDLDQVGGRSETETGNVLFIQKTPDAGYGVSTMINSHNLCIDEANN